ncbi:hypothetical protein P7K49_037982 [Saguinus oedipus]|uniref:AGC-kinase C-terminal domain-containing protein n=1 Tax=Saguinus oedipus TaxID=9490 RepID=A0ABQ9TDE2_SAGOE|nr:hypothetical protein P7K49_037982 [Saguinus oedipus]
MARKEKHQNKALGLVANSVAVLSVGVFFTPESICIREQPAAAPNNGANDVKRHRWFRAVDWEAVPQRKLKQSSLLYECLSANRLPDCLSFCPPIVPKISGDGDTSNFETYPENDWDTATPVPQKDLEIFKNF